MAAAKDLTVRNLTIEQNGACAGGFQAAGFFNADGGVSWLSGTVDPRGRFQAPCGTLYSRKITTAGDEIGTAGELWITDGPTANDWQRVYPVGTP